MPKNWQNMPQICQKYNKIRQNMPKMTKYAKICQKNTLKYDKKYKN